MFGAIRVKNKAESNKLIVLDNFSVHNAIRNLKLRVYFL